MPYKQVPNPFADDSSLDDSLGEFYPDLIAEGLTTVLQRMLESKGGDLKLNPGCRRDSAGLEQGAREAWIGIALNERSFHFTLLADGVEFVSAWIGSLDEVIEAIVFWFGSDRPGCAELAARHPGFSINELAVSYEQGRAHDLMWERLLSSAGGLIQFVEAVASRPSLRRLYPLVSRHMTMLSFSRLLSSYFWESGDLPCAIVHVTPHSGWASYGGPYHWDGEELVTIYPEAFDVHRSPREWSGDQLQKESLVGTGDAETAADLLVAALPQQVDVVYRPAWKVH